MLRRIPACLTVLALCTIHASTSYASSSSTSLLTPVTVEVFNDAGVARPVLKSAELEAERIFEAAHIQIRWRDCLPAQGEPAHSRCDDLRAPNDLSLRILPGANKQNDDVFGVAFLAANGTGTYSDVFYGSVERFCREGHDSIGRLLGHVIAHEIGHLLIGSHAHAPSGIMSARWQAQELLRLEMGTLFFTAEQKKSMYSRLHGGSTVITNLQAKQ